ncbi:MAG: hypothetical protein ABW215_02500 [Kibdelosporangium sp.]
MIAFDSTSAEVELGALGPLERIRTGGRGTVYGLAGHEHLAYKAFADDVPVDADELTRFVRFVRELDETTAGELLERAAWPVNVVFDDGVVCGYVMPRAPAGFTVDLKWETGRSCVPGDIGLLLNDAAYLRNRGLAISDEFRLQFLRDAARTLALLHRLDIGVGDPSWLFGQSARPCCFLVGCDGMRLGGDTVLDLVESAEWRTAEHGDEAPATPASDNYKLGLLAIRLFAGDEDSRDPAVVPTRLRPLVTRALDNDPDARPQATEWAEPITAALQAQPGRPQPIEPNRPGEQPTTPPVNTRNTGRTAVGTLSKPPPKPPPKPAAKPSGKSWWGLAALVAPLAIIIGSINADNSGTRDSTPIRMPTGAWTKYLDPTYRPPGLLDLPPYRPTYLPPRISIPPISLRPLCLRTVVLYAKGVAADPKVSDVISKACDGHGTVTITRIGKGANNTLVASIRFTDAADKCRRSTYTLTPAADSYTISGVTSPVAATGCP